MVSLWHGACTHPFVLVPYKARKELNLADVEPEEDPQAKDWNPIGGWMFGLSFCGSTWGRQRWGLPLAGNIVAFREDLVAFSQGIVREKGKDWTSLLPSIFNCCMSQGLKILYIHGFQEHLLVLFS